MIKSAYNVLKKGEPNYPHRKNIKATGVLNALNIAFRTAPDLAEGEVLLILRQKTDDHLRPLLLLANGAPAPRRGSGINGWITFERVGERLKITNFDYCDLDLLKKSCALMGGVQFDAVDAETTVRTQRNVAK